MDASGVEKFRILVNFRSLNDVTVDEVHPLPNITEILDQYIYIEFLYNWYYHA